MIASEKPDRNRPARNSEPVMAWAPGCAVGFEPAARSMRARRSPLRAGATERMTATGDVDHDPRSDSTLLIKADRKAATKTPASPPAKPAGAASSQWPALDARIAPITRPIPAQTGASRAESGLDPTGACHSHWNEACNQHENPNGKHQPGRKQHAPGQRHPLHARRECTAPGRRVGPSDLRTKFGNLIRPRGPFNLDLDPLRSSVALERRPRPAR